jgi:hypothetical protein
MIPLSICSGAGREEAGKRELTESKKHTPPGRLLTGFEAPLEPLKTFSRCYCELQKTAPCFRLSQNKTVRGIPGKKQ